MASSSPAYLLPGPAPSIGSKSTLIKANFPPHPTAAIQSVHHMAQHQLHHPIHRPSASLHSHQPYSRTAPNGDIFHSLTIANTGNGAALLTTNHNNNNNTPASNNSSPTVLTTINTDDNSGGGGSSGHSLSQSMESINNIGLSDDEVS